MTPANAFVNKLLENTDISGVAPQPDDVNPEHYLNWLEQDLKIYRCPFCDSDLSKHYSVVRHYVNKDTGEIAYVEGHYEGGDGVFEPDTRLHSNDGRWDLPNISDRCTNCDRFEDGSNDGGGLLEAKKPVDPDDPEANLDRYIDLAAESPEEWNQRQKPIALRYQQSLKPPGPGASARQIERFVSGINWNLLIADDEGDGCYFHDTGQAGVFCTGYAVAIGGIFGKQRTTIYGYYEEDNPTSRIAQDTGGHDFAVVDGRYVVDPWIAHVESYSKRVVFDLNSNEDAKVIQDLYGDKNLWQRNHGAEKEIVEIVYEAVDPDDPARYIDDLEPLLKASEPVRPYDHPTVDVAEYRQLLDTRTGRKVGLVRFYNGVWTWHGAAWDTKWWQSKVTDADITPLFHKQYATLDDLIHDASYTFRRIRESMDIDDPEAFLSSMSDPLSALKGHGFQQIEPQKWAKLWPVGNGVVWIIVRFVEHPKGKIWTTFNTYYGDAGATQHYTQGQPTDNHAKFDSMLTNVAIAEMLSIMKTCHQENPEYAAKELLWNLVNSAERLEDEARKREMVRQGEEYNRRRREMGEALDPDDPQHYVDWLIQDRHQEQLRLLPEMSFGFAIYTTEQSLIEDNAREREELIPGGVLTEEMWEKLNADIERLERNALEVLNTSGFLARDEGHDGNDSALVGTAWVKAKSQTDAEADPRGIYALWAYLAHEEPLGTGRGTFGAFGKEADHKIWDGLSEYGQSLLDVDIDFFNLDEEIKPWFERNEAYIQNMVQESAEPDDVPNERYLEDIVSIGDFKHDATNYGFALNQYDAWGRYIIFSGGTYWQTIQDQPITEPVMRDLMAEFLQKHGITEHRLNMSVGKTDEHGNVAYFLVQLAVPKHFFTDESMVLPVGSSRYRTDADPDWAKKEFPFIANESIEDEDSPESYLDFSPEQILQSGGFRQVNHRCYAKIVPTGDSKNDDVTIYANLGPAVTGTKPFITFEFMAGNPMAGAHIDFKRVSVPADWLNIIMAVITRYEPEMLKLTSADYASKMLSYQINLAHWNIVQNREKKVSEAMTGYTSKPGYPPKQPPRGQQYRVKVGKSYWFEYHCQESDDSADADLWYHSHQRCQVLHMEEPGDGKDEIERGENGASAAYRIRFRDGFQHTGMEDELCDSIAEFNRPDPPPPPWLRKDKGKKLLYGKGFGGPYESAEDEVERYLNDINPNAVQGTYEEQELLKRGFTLVDARTHRLNWIRERPDSSWSIRKALLKAGQIGWVAHHYTPADAKLYRGTFDELLALVDNPLTEAEEFDAEKEFERLTTPPDIHAFVRQLGFKQDSPGSWWRPASREDKWPHYLLGSEGVPEHTTKTYVDGEGYSKLALNLKFEVDIVGFRFYDPYNKKWLGYRQDDKWYDLKFHPKDAHHVITVIAAADQAMLALAKREHMFTAEKIGAALWPVCEAAEQHWHDAWGSFR